MSEWRGGQITVLISEPMSVRRRTLSVAFPACAVGCTVNVTVVARIDEETPHTHTVEVPVLCSHWEYMWTMLSAAWTPRVSAMCSSSDWSLISIAVPDLASSQKGDFVTFQFSRPMSMILVSSDRLALPAFRVETGRPLTERATVVDTVNLLYELLTGRLD